VNPEVTLMQRFRTRLWLAIAAATVAVIAESPSAAGARIGIEVIPGDGCVIIDAVASVDAASDVAWQVLTDYPRYPEFIPGVRSSRVTRRDGDAITVEQGTHAFVGSFAIPVTVVYEIAESVPRDLWSSTDLPLLGVLRSHYRLRSEGRRSRLEYSGRLAPSTGTLPALQRTALVDTVTRQFQALAEEIERRAGSRNPGDDR
jgi:hypothetical protein